MLPMMNDELRSLPQHTTLQALVANWQKGMMVACLSCPEEMLALHRWTRPSWGVQLQMRKVQYRRVRQVASCWICIQLAEPESQASLRPPRPLHSLLKGSSIEKIACLVVLAPKIVILDMHWLNGGAQHSTAAQRAHYCFGWRHNKCLNLWEHWNHLDKRMMPPWRRRELNRTRVNDCNFHGALSVRVWRGSDLILVTLLCSTNLPKYSKK